MGGNDMAKYMFFASNFNRWAGPNNHLLDISNYLYNKLNIDLSLVTHDTAIESNFSDHIKFPILKVMKGSKSSPSTRLLSTPINARIIRKIIQKQCIRPNHVFVNSSIDTLFAVKQAIQCRVNTGYNILGNDRNSLLFNMLDSLAVKSAIGKIVAHTRFQQSFFLELGIREEDIHFVPHCIDLERVLSYVDNKTAKRESDRVTVFYGGRITKAKGIKELLECCHSLARQGYVFDLVLVGDGDLREWVIEKVSLINRDCAKVNIRFIAGWQSAQVLLNEMSKSDIVVLPSYHEMCPIVVLEAMCLGKAIIATNKGGTIDLLGNGENGILIDPFSNSDLADSLTTLIGDKKMRCHFGRKAFESLKNTYDVSAVAPKLLTFLNS